MTLGLSFFPGPEVPAIVAPAVSENRDRLPGQVGGVFGLGPEGVPDPAQAPRLGPDVADAVPFPVRLRPRAEGQDEFDLLEVLPALPGGFPIVHFDAPGEFRSAATFLPGPGEADPESADALMSDSPDRLSRTDVVGGAGDVALTFGRPFGTEGPSPSDLGNAASPAGTGTGRSSLESPLMSGDLSKGTGESLVAPEGPNPVRDFAPPLKAVVAPRDGSGLPVPLRPAAPLEALPVTATGVNTTPPITGQRETSYLKWTERGLQGVGAVPSGQGHPTGKPQTPQLIVQQGAGLGPQPVLAPGRPEAADMAADGFPVARAATDTQPSPSPSTARGPLEQLSNPPPVRTDLSAALRAGGRTDATAAPVVGAQISPEPDPRLSPNPDGPQPRTRGADLAGRVSVPSAPEPAALLQPGPAPPDLPTRVTRTDAPIPLPRDATPATPSIHARLQSQVREALSAGPLPVEVVLDPPELGRLRLRLGGAEQPQHVVVTVDRPETLDLMRRHGDQFLRDLRDAGWSGLSLALDSGASGSRQGHAYLARGDLPQGPAPGQAPPEPDPSLLPTPPVPTQTSITGRVDRRL